MDIYWIDKERKRCGPATVPDMISKVRTGELSAETLGWHAGAVGWVPLRDLPALTDFLTERAPKHITYDPNDPMPELDDRDTPPTMDMRPAEAPTEADMPQGVERLYLPAPGVRLMARLVDMSLYTVLAYFVLYVQHMPFNLAYLPSNPLFWLGMLVLEPLLLCTCGTTPGKALFRLRVRMMGARMQDGQLARLSFGRAFARTLLVFVLGLGMMLSILPIFTMLFSRWQMRRQGVTAWDVRTGAVQDCKPPVPSAGMRTVMAVIIMFCCLQCTSFLMQPWTPAMLDAITEQNPDLGAKLRSLLPEEPPSPEK
ncbi:MAG: RDD family protein [Akkermansia sp.]|nr:RDD family protein [Akkermansia sp.]